MGLFSRLVNKAQIGATKARAKQIVQILWNNYQAIVDDSLSEEEKWLLAVVHRFMRRRNESGLLSVKAGGDDLITDFKSACIYVCEIEIRRQPPIMQGSAGMRELVAITEGIEEKMAQVRARSH